MKPQTITKSTIRHPFQIQDIVRWLESNGVRHYVPEDARIIVTGNYIIVPTLDVGRTYNPNYWGNWRRTDALPVKIRKYRIRHELRGTNEPTH